MARDTEDDTPIEDRAQLTEYLEAGCKPPERFRIGTEHEKFAFTLSDHAPVPYDGPSGIGAVLSQMAELTGWDAICEKGNVIGLADPAGGGAISLEPGGQFELSGAPLETLHETCVEANAHLAQVRQVSEALGLGFLGLGMAPTWSREQMPRMPKQRYDIMTRHMPKVGTRGLDMMYRTATIQVNLDFSSEADMVRKTRVSLALQPIATALFANSPFLDGAPNGLRSNRAAVWHDVDLARSGPIPFVFEEGFGFERYTDWVLDVPMYFVKRGERYIDATSATFRDYLDGRYSPEPGAVPTMGDWVNHLSTVFPEVRLKRFLEMRGADGGPWRRICALPALWVGLLYDEGALGEAEAICADFTPEIRRELWQTVPRDGLTGTVGGRSVKSIAQHVVSVADKGLRARAKAAGGMDDERHFLDPLQVAAHSGRSPADDLIDAYKGNWNRDLDEIFSADAF
ncbi:MAG: glutamate--cysteine ligase [Pseudomonadota bacterium]